MKGLYKELECMECGSEVDLLKLTLTDKHGVVLDQQVICRDCAIEKGWRLEEVRR